MGADRITQGTLGTTGQDVYDSPGAIIADAVNGLLGVVTTTKAIALAASRALNLGQQTALTAITTAQNLMTQAFGAGALNVAGRTLRVRGALIYSTTSTNVATITIALTLGGVTLCTITTAATNTAASTNLPIQFDFTMTVATTGTAATIQSHGRVDANIGTVAAAVVVSYLDTNTGVSSAVNLTVAATLAVTIAASAAVPSAQLLSGSVDLLA